MNWYETHPDAFTAFQHESCFTLNNARPRAPRHRADELPGRKTIEPPVGLLPNSLRHAGGYVYIASLG